MNQVVGVEVVRVICRKTEDSRDPARSGGGLAGSRAVDIGRQSAVVVVGIHQKGEGKLSRVVETRNSLAFLFCAVQGGQEHGSQNRNNGDDNKQLD